MFDVSNKPSFVGENIGLRPENKLFLEPIYLNLKNFAWADPEAAVEKNAPWSQAAID